MYTINITGYTNTDFGFRYWAAEVQEEACGVARKRELWRGVRPVAWRNGDGQEPRWAEATPFAGQNS